MHNPIGVKLGPTATADDALALAARLNPENEAGRLTFITRFGAGKIRDGLPGLVEKVTAEGYGFQIEMAHRMVRAGGRVVEFPIVFPDRVEGVSKMSGSIVREAFGLVLRLWVLDFWGRRHRRAQGG